MSQHQIDILQRALERERRSRKQAEKTLEAKASELYRTSLELKETNERLEKLVNEKTSELEGFFENIIDAYVIIDFNGDILKMNDAAIEMVGYDIKEEGLNLEDLMPLDESYIANKTFRNLINTGQLSNFQARIITKDKAEKIVQINASLIYKNGKPRAVQGIARDVTKEKKAESKLKESNERLATLIRNLDNAILLENENREVVLTNKRFCEYFNIPLSPEKMVGMDCSNAAEESKRLFKDPEKFVNDIERILKERRTVFGDELKMADGKVLERDYVPIFNDKRYKGHLWSYQDVTLRNRYFKNIEGQKQKYSNIIANMNLGLIEVNTNGTIVLVNQSFCEMSGFTEDELIGQNSRKLLIEKGEKEILNIQSLKESAGESNSYETAFRTKKGELRQWLVSEAINRDLNGDIVGSIGVHLDITDLKTLEAEKEKLVSQLEKSNDELHEYAHIVSHDLKSPLRSINALINWVEQDNKEKLDEASLQNIELIKSTLEKMEDLISNILNYSSLTGNNELSQVDVHELVTNIISILYIPDHININLKNNLPQVTADETKLQQVFQNLLTNAIKYNDKDKGVIEIDVKDDDEFYQFSIQDNGIGIDEKHQNDIFKVFHTINKSEDSTGLGLSMVKKIVELHGGNIWLRSKPGLGSTFFFTIKKQKNANNVN